MKFKILSAILLSFLSLKIYSSDKTDTDWKALLTANKLSYADQAYCYTDEFGQIYGENIDEQVRLASVSKLVTSLWAIDVLGSNYKYNTKLFIKNGNLHIAGTFDPFMGNEKMFFLLSQLNGLGYSKFDTITFDKNLLVFPNAQGYNEEYPQITSDSIAKNLLMYFNTKSWSPNFRELYTQIADASRNRIRKSVTFEIKGAKVVDKNPFENDPTAKVLTLSSPPLYKYLKEVNVESNNFVAHTLYMQLGGEQKFSDYLVEHFGLTASTIHFWTGSGLPTMQDGKRKDNYATCSSMLSLIQALKQACERQSIELEDIVAVPGSDAGTFRNRVFPADYKNAFVAKSGTLVHTSALAGAMSTKSGFNFYGIFNQTNLITGAKTVQNEMVRSIMTELGGPKVFDYHVSVFDPYGSDNIKNLMEIILHHSEFIPFEENLY